MNNLFFRVSSAAVGGYLGWALEHQLAEERATAEAWWWSWSVIIASVLLGFFLIPYVIGRPLRWLQQQIIEIPPSVLLASAGGLLTGLALGALLAIPLSFLPGYAGQALPIIASLALVYAGAVVGAIRGRDLAIAFASFLGNQMIAGRRIPSRAGQVLVDTSAVIDGRIADVGQTGFIQGTLLIPRFILDELRHVADSTDSLRRNRGRRGLDILNKLQKESDAPIEIVDLDTDEAPDVDSKLVALARGLRCPIITTDFNLNRVAELQGVRVLNINELANAVKSVVLPGEEMTVRVIQEGKEIGQGVAFLDDGTMIVVEGGRRHLNNQLDIVVTRVLQTVAGRMIFAHPK